MSSLRLRFSLRTLLLGMLLLASAGSLWWGWEPWVVEQIFVGHTDGSFSVMFSPDGRYLVTPSKDSTARVWSRVRGGTQAILDHKTDVWTWVTHAEFSPDSQRILTRDYNGDVRMWDAEAGKELFRLPAEHLNEGQLGSEIRAVSFSPNCSRILGYVDGGAIIWDANTGKRVLEIPQKGQQTVCALFTPDGSRFVVSGYSGPATVYDTTNGTTLTTITTKRFPHRRPFSSDSRRLICGQEDGRICVSHLDFYKEDFLGPECNPTPNGTFPDEIDCRQARFSPDNRYGIVKRGADTVEVWDITEKKLCHALHPNGGVKQIEVAPGGDRIYTVSEAGDLTIWDFDTGESLTTFKLPNTQITTFALSADGGYLAAVCADFSVRLYARRRDESIFGILALPELWLTILLIGLFAWSLLRDRREAQRASATIHK